METCNLLTIVALRFFTVSLFGLEDLDMIICFAVDRYVWALELYEVLTSMLLNLRLLCLVCWVIWLVKTRPRYDL